MMRTDGRDYNHIKIPISIAKYHKHIVIQNNNYTCLDFFFHFTK